MSALTFQIDVSRTYKNKDGYKAGGYRLNRSFRTETHTPETFLDSVIRPGWPYTMVHLKRSPHETGAAARGVKTPKHTENFVSRQELTGDDDSKAPGVIDFWLHDPFFGRYGWAFVESVNSIPGQAEKGHPTIIFDRPVSDPDLYRECARALAWKYPQLDQGIHNIDRTIYNAEGARVHPLGNICPFEVFEREILKPYREHLARQAAIEAEYQAHRRAELDRAKAEGQVTKDAGRSEQYLLSGLDGIFRFVAGLTRGRHNPIYWAGQKIGEYKAADWTRLYMPVETELEARIIEAARLNGYLATYANNNESEVLRTFNDGQLVGQASPAPEPEFYDRPGRPGLKEPGPKELERIATREQYLAEARARREEKETQRQARQAELDRRWQAGDVIPFLADAVDPDEVQRLRGRFTSAEKWRAYCVTHYPDVDADEQYRIKLIENREARPGTCGEYRKQNLPNGQIRTYRWACGVCDDCLKRAVWFYRRALNEIQGIPSAPPANLLELLENGQGNDAPRENAPPLPKIKGDLSIVRVYSDRERLHLARELRTAGIAYRANPITLEDGDAYDVVVNDDRGDPLGLVADERLLLWARGAEGKRASGGLLPSLKSLQRRYREALPFEVVCPELDDEGQPVDPDIFSLELPDIGTQATLPAVAVGFDVRDAETLQAALFEIHREQWRILGRRGDVNYGVCIHKKFYTRYSTLPCLLAEFNAQQEAIRQKKYRS